MIKILARLIAKMLGWKFVVRNDLPKKYVFVAAPHTSNWDGFYMIITALACGLRISWVAKHTLLQGASGWFLKKLGGIPVVRNSRQNLVSQIVEIFNRSDKLALGVPPEGTRSKADYWKSGFYHIAREAQVPIVLSFLDYKHKIAGLGPEILPGKDTMTQDMDAVRKFYKDVHARYPEKVGPIRLEAEMSS